MGARRGDVPEYRPRASGRALPAATVSRRPQPSEEMLGKEAEGLSHGAERESWAESANRLVSPFRPVLVDRLAGLGSGHLQPRQSREHSCLYPIDTPGDAAAAAAAVSAAERRPHPFLRLSRGGGDQEKMLRVCALQKKITCCRQCALLRGCPLPIPSSFLSSSSSLCSQATAELGPW